MPACRAGGTTGAGAFDFFRKWLAETPYRQSASRREARCGQLINLITRCGLTRIELLANAPSDNLGKASEKATDFTGGQLTEDWPGNSQLASRLAE
jgi:hypothetical protein